MTPDKTGTPTDDKSPAQKRKYESPLRKQQIAETRERIVSAGSQLVHEFPTWEWTNLTARAVGERAGVAERTVHRHFSSERDLRQTVLLRLVEESGVQLEDFALKDFGKNTARMFDYLLSFSAKTESARSLDPALAGIEEYRRNQLLNAVAGGTPGWTDRERKIATAGLNILWDPANYERIRLLWDFDRETSIRAITWLIELIQAAIARGEKP